MKHEAMMQHESASHAGGAAGAPRRAAHNAHSHHAHMVADFRRRFWISLALTVPILAISEHFWALMGLRPLISFAGDRYALFAFASIVYFYGGWPFLKGAGGEIAGRKPGERVPADAVIVAGVTSLDESMLTGESKPVDKGEGAEVIGGSVNGDGAITIEIRKTGRETYLAQVMDMVRRAQESRSRSQDLANRPAVWLTAIALGVGAATFVAWLAI